MSGHVAAALALAMASAAGCARCSQHPEPDAGPPPFELPDPLPVPKAWTFTRAPGGQFSLPTGCVERAPPSRLLAPPSTRFAAEPRSLATLVVGESQGTPPELVAAGALPLNPDGASGTARALPWVQAELLPKLARGAGGVWLAALDVPPDAAAGPARVALWRDGTAALAGEGDGFTAIDLACVGDRCALLTTRPAVVAQPGATVWIGTPREAIAAWKRVDIALPAAAMAARPFSITRLAAHAVEIALQLEGEIAFWSAEGEPREIGRVPLNHGILEATSDPTPLALTYGAAVDDEGCPKDPLGPTRPSMKIERPAQPPLDLPMAAPPNGATLRTVGQGILVTWLMPAGCRSPHRAAYALLLDAHGAPRATPVAATTLGEATGFAVAASGNDVDFWFQNETFVTWIRGRCDAVAP